MNVYIYIYIYILLETTMHIDVYTFCIFQDCIHSILHNLILMNAIQSRYSKSTIFYKMTEVKQ